MKLDNQTRAAFGEASTLASELWGYIYQEGIGMSAFRETDLPQLQFISEVNPNIQTVYCIGSAHDLTPIFGINATNYYYQDREEIDSKIAVALNKLHEKEVIQDLEKVMLSDEISVKLGKGMREIKSHASPQYSFEVQGQKKKLHVYDNLNFSESIPYEIDPDLVYANHTMISDEVLERVNTGTLIFYVRGLGADPISPIQKSKYNLLQIDLSNQKDMIETAEMYVKLKGGV